MAFAGIVFPRAEDEHTAIGDSIEDVAGWLVDHSEPSPNFVPGQTVNADSQANFGVGAFLLAACEYVRYIKHGAAD